MKIAIMGAGLSGLACAITLEKNGFSPVIFEKRNQVGDRFVNCEALLPVLARPINDCYAYLSEKYGIFLQPIRNIRNMILHSENNQSTISGHLGFSNLRGRTADSFENQLAKQVKSKIVFNSKYTYEQLLKEYTHVVMATGDAAYAAKVQDFQEDFTVTLKGATVEGQFNPYDTVIWLNNDLAPKGYGYLIPISEKEANITIGYPNYPQNQVKDVNMLWDGFYSQVCKDLNQNLRITDNFQITKYIIGTCKYPRIGNTFFVGNCFGAIMPAFGFGQLAAILTGIYAAYDLCGLGNYEEMTKHLLKSYKNSLVLRRSMEQLNNQMLDILVSSFDTKLANRVFNNPKRDPFKVISYLLRPFVMNKHTKI